MRDVLEIGYVVGEFAYGEGGARILAAILGVLLISTVSAMLLAGPRALQVIGEDFPVFRFLAAQRDASVPRNAILFQATLTLVMVITSTFKSVLLFASFALALNTLLAVLGVVVLRVRQPGLTRPFRIPFYPFPVLIYAGITI